MAYDFEKWVANDLQKIRRRRWLPYFQASMMVVLAALGVLEVFDDGGDNDRISDLSMFALIVLSASLASPFARDMWLGPRRDKVFDEFERDALAKATTHAYIVVQALLTALFLWLWIGSDNGWPIPQTRLDWSAIGFAVCGIVGALPIFFAEIMVPFPPAGEAVDD